MRTAGYTWDTLQNKCTNYKGVKYNTKFGQITGIQGKLDTTCKQNASKQITQGNETLLPNWQKESWQIFEDFWIRETGTGQQVAQLHDRYDDDGDDENYSRSVQ